MIKFAGNSRGMRAFACPAAVAEFPAALFETGLEGALKRLKGAVPQSN